MTSLDKIRAINGIVGERLPLRIAAESIGFNMTEEQLLANMLDALREEVAKIEQIASA